MIKSSALGCGVHSGVGTKLIIIGVEASTWVLWSVWVTWTASMERMPIGQAESVAERSLKGRKKRLWPTEGYTHTNRAVSVVASGDELSAALADTQQSLSPTAKLVDVGTLHLWLDRERERDQLLLHTTPKKRHSIQKEPLCVPAKLFIRVL
jgi:hypothetical protein